MSYLESVGKTVLKERKKRKMSQIRFYKFLFPGHDIADANIKSKMNDIEKSKRKNVDLEFLEALHDKCNLSMDYIFGYEALYPNHENRNASEYTGLSVDIIEVLHEIALSKVAELPSLEPGMGDDEFSKWCQIKSKKQEAEWILKIIEVLLNEEESKVGDSYPNYNILFDLYMISVMKPKKIRGLSAEDANKDYDFMQASFDVEELCLDSIYMEDSFGFNHYVDIDKVFQQIWKNKLNEDVERLIPIVRKRFSDSFSTSSQNSIFDIESST